MDDDAAFLADVTAFLTENNEQLDVPSLPAAVDDVILDPEAVALLPSDVTPPSGRKGRREVRNAKAAERRRKYRVKVTAEKAALHHEEDVLSLQLKNMEADRANNRSHHAQSSMWRSVALRARWERVKAEEQYLQLHAAVTYRSRLIGEMKDLIRQLVTSPVDILVPSVNEYGRQADNLTLFQTIVSEIDTLYEQVDQVFPHAETKLSWPIELKLARKRSQSGEFFDSANATVIPFDFDDICRALSILVLSGPDKCRYTEGIQDAENIYASQHTINFSLEPHTTRGINVYVATKRFQESGRVVFVWRSLYVGDTSFSGIQADETGWLVARRFPSAARAGESGQNSLRSTILESYTRVVPLGDGEATCGSDAVDRFTSTISSTGEEEVKRVMRMLERMLIQGKVNFTSHSTVSRPSDQKPPRV